MGIISVENTDRLFWLGRYSERVYTTIRLFAASYDQMIDIDFNNFQDFCKKLDIPNIYRSKRDFIEKYSFDEFNPNSIYANLMRAYDNAVVLREEIGSETLSYIQLAVYEMQKAKDSSSPLIELQKVMDNILAFWGIADDSIDAQHVRNIIKIGKRVERLDLYGRLHMDRKEIIRETRRLTDRIARTGLTYDEEKVRELNDIVLEEKMDYYSVVQTVDSLLNI